MVDDTRQESQLPEDAAGQPSAADAGRRADDGETSLIDLLIALGEEKKLLFGLPLAASVLAAIYSLLVPVAFTASTTFLPPQQQQSMAAAALQQLGGLAGLAGATMSLRKPEDLYVTILKSDTLQNAVIERFDLMKRYDATYRQDARNALTDNVTVNVDRSGLLKLEATDGDPAFAAQLANAHVEELRKFLGSLAVTEAQQRRVFFEKQLQKANENLKSAQLALGEAGVAESLIKSSPEAVVAGIANLKAQITAQEVRLSTMRGYLTEQSPQFKLAQGELASLRAQLTQAEQNEPAKGTQRAEYLSRFRDFKYYETLFDLMAKQYELARLDEAREGPLVQQVDVAYPPEFRSKPARRKIVLTVGMAAGLIAVVLVLILAAIRKARADPAQMRQFEALLASWRIRSRP